MFESNITVKRLLDELKNEVDIAVPVSDETYIAILNTLEQLLYTELIQEQRIISLSEEKFPLAIEDLLVEDEATIRFEDVYSVYAGETQLTKTTAQSAAIFADTFYKDGNKIAVNTRKKPTKIVYFVKPALKTVETMESDTVKLPYEFVELAKAKIRGEIYKIVNEDEHAAKWLNDYNVLLETFKVWMANKSPQFGM